ncbi:hypothetical protein VCSRO174_3579 [Vibrio cholerae]|nr:hypothetical protein VCSRO174_3579 [Vibrio cholerae]
MGSTFKDGKLASRVLSRNISTISIIIKALGGADNIQDVQQERRKILVTLKNLEVVDTGTLNDFGCTKIDFTSFTTVSFFPVVGSELFFYRIKGFLALSIT